MQIYLPILALALGSVSAIDEPHQICADFITVRSGAPQKLGKNRVRRDWLDSTESVTTEVMTSEVMMTSEVTTNEESGSATTEEVTQTPEPSTTVEATTVEATTVEATTLKATTEKVTTLKPTTVEPTTVEPTTVDVTTEPPTTIEPTTESVNDEDKAILVILDETGSMQDLGGPYPKHEKKGRDVAIKKMEKFREHLEDSVNNGGDDYPITFVTFNKAAKWSKYNSIKDWPKITRKDYNPGYATNLFDTLGCVLSKYKSENPNQSVDVYLISDGIHGLSRKSNPAVYDESTISGMVEDLRDDHWNFYFFGAVNAEKKPAMKRQAKRLGFRASELRVFGFDSKSFGNVLKTISFSIVKPLKPKKVALPDCKVLKPCKKGRPGKYCRKGRKTMEAKGECKFY